MVTRTRTYKVCDGCFRDELTDGVEIVRSERKRPHLDNDYGTVDLCAECVEAEKYFCRLCENVHDDEHPCEAQKETNR